MTRMVCLWAVLAVAWSPAASSAAADASKPNSTLLRCEPVYMPARSVWVREVEMVAENGHLKQLLIDGQAVYTFSVQGSTVFTSLDNERIQIDFAQRSWRSDFRGLATGEGRCELQEPLARGGEVPAS